MTGQINITGSLVDDHGTWAVRARFADKQGDKPRLHSKTTGIKVARGNKRKAEAKMKEIVNEWEEQLQRDIPEHTEPTFGDCVSRWLEIKKHTVRNVTYGCYEYTAKKYVLPALGDIKMSELTRMDLQDYINAKTDVYSVNTIKDHLKVINGTVDLAVLDGIIQSDKGNILGKVILPTAEKKEAAFLSEEDVGRVLDGLAEEREPIPAIVTLGLCYGLRRAEIAGLRWEDVDFEHDVIHIRNTIVEVNGKYFESERTKTSSSTRDLPMIASTKPYLQDLHEKRKKQGMLCNKVCAKENGKPICMKSCNVCLREYLDKLGIDKRVHLHSLRHTAASILVKRIPVIYASKFLGHSNTATTMNIYAHLMNKDVYKASETMNDFFDELAHGK